MAVLLSGVVVLLGFAGLSIQQNDPGKVTCYSWTGQEFNNNTICAGSNVCCNTEDLCSPNRFCLANNQTIVPACAVFPWNNCANICQYDPGTGFLPRAVQCDDGSYCCDNNPQCCANNEGIVLNGLGAIVSTDGGLAALSTSSTSSTSSSSAVPSTASATSTSTSFTRSASSSPTSSGTASAAETPSVNETKSSSLSAAAIAGIAIGAAAFILGLGAFLFWVGRRRGKREHLDEQIKKQSSAFDQQLQDPFSPQFLHGTPVYNPLPKEKSYENAYKVDSRPPQELFAGTPVAKR